MKEGTTSCGGDASAAGWDGGIMKEVVRGINIVVSIMECKGQRIDQATANTEGTSRLEGTMTETKKIGRS